MKKKRMLLVEDDQHAVDALIRVLSQALPDLEIVTICDPSGRIAAIAATTRIDQGGIDLVVCDGLGGAWRTVWAAATQQIIPFALHTTLDGAFGTITLIEKPDTSALVRWVGAQ